MSDVNQRSHNGGSAVRVATDDVASYINEAEARLDLLIRKQFLFMSIAVIGSVMILIGAFAVITGLSRAPSNANLLNQIEDSNRQLSSITQSVLQSTTPSTTTMRVLGLVIAQEEAHQSAIEEIRRVQQQPSPESQSLLQIISSTAALALLGALGLQRLQNIDTEINNVRESVFSQAEARSKANRVVLTAIVGDRIAKQFAETQKHLEERTNLLVESRFMKTQKRIENLTEQVNTSIDDFQQQARTKLKEVGQQIEAAEKQVAEVGKLLDQYPWLKSREASDTASRISALSSVGQAYDLARAFNLSGDKSSAQKALQAIISESLPGNAADFHSAHTEALRLSDARLALEIVDAGLSLFEDQYDLTVDKASALYRLGRAEDARQLIEGWRQRKPAEFTRGWRPVVFYVELFQALNLTPEVSKSVESALKEVTDRLPYEIKPWSAYAQFVAGQGRLGDAEEILLKALQFNPLSQQLNFALGRLFLIQGKGEEARDQLKTALRFDYQSRYERDTNQCDLCVMLAQAYEACNDRENAKQLYKDIVADESAPPHVQEYARNRITALAWLGDELLAPKNPTTDPKEVSNLPEQIGHQL